MSSALHVSWKFNSLHKSEPCCTVNTSLKARAESVLQSQRRRCRLQVQNRIDYGTSDRYHLFGSKYSSFLGNRMLGEKSLEMNYCKITPQKTFAKKAQYVLFCISDSGGITSCTLNLRGSVALVVAIGKFQFCNHGVDNLTVIPLLVFNSWWIRIKWVTESKIIQRKNYTEKNTCRNFAKTLLIFHHVLCTH